MVACTRHPLQAASSAYRRGGSRSDRRDGVRSDDSRRNETSMDGIRLGLRRITIPTAFPRGEMPPLVDRVANKDADNDGDHDPCPSVKDETHPRHDVSADGQRFLMIKNTGDQPSRSASIVVALNWVEELKASAALGSRRWRCYAAVDRTLGRSSRSACSQSSTSCP
jgi:hypothetical protein